MKHFEQLLESLVQFKVPQQKLDALRSMIDHLAALDTHYASVGLPNLQALKLQKILQQFLISSTAIFLLKKYTGKRILVVQGTARAAIGTPSYDRIVRITSLAGPDWIKSKALLYDVVAKTPDGSTRDQNLASLRKLLTERLKIVSHHEQRELSYLALVVAKGGAKMTMAKEDAAPLGPALFGDIVNHHMTMHTLALLLSRFEKQTVLDMTTMDGAFEVSLQWNPEQAKEDDERPSLYSALPQQLGLRLEARKGPVDVLVVDSAEKVPAEN